VDNSSKSLLPWQKSITFTVCWGGWVSQCRHNATFFHCNSFDFHLWSLPFTSTTPRRKW